MSSVTVYDKAKYHSGGNWPAGLPARQSFVHTGLFLGWLIDRDLVRGVQPALVALFKERRMSGPDVFRAVDGVLDSGMLTEDGNAFCREYSTLAQGGGRFIEDYESLLASSLPSVYHVADTWENYGALAELLDRRLAEWRAKRRS